MTRDDASEQTGINSTTLYRIETARGRPQMRTLTTLLNLYGVTGEQRDYLTSLCREATTQGWLRPYHAELPEEYTAYISFEDEAEIVRNYQSMFIPGLLQTEDYARATINGVLVSAAPEDVESRVRARMERQSLLTRPRPLRLWAIVDEAALRRVVGGREVMRTQLLHLTEIVMAHNITFQVIPFEAGAHPGMQGQFVLMSFGDPMDTDLIYIGNVAGDLFLEADAEVRRYRSIFDNLTAVALSPNDSVTLVTKIARDTER
jgi:transcriptional regulator with XRE-family HTH domain